MRLGLDSVLVYQSDNRRHGPHASTSKHIASFASHPSEARGNHVAAQGRRLRLRACPSVSARGGACLILIIPLALALLAALLLVALALVDERVAKRPEVIPLGVVLALDLLTQGLAALLVLVLRVVVGAITCHVSPMAERMER